MLFPSEDHTPVVLYGALRSGTTLLRLILTHHSELQNPCETDFLFDHIVPDPTHPTGWRYNISTLKEDWIFRSSGISLPKELTGRDLFEALLDELRRKAPEQRLVLVCHRNAEKMNALLPGAPILHLVRDPRDVARSSVQMGWAGNSYFAVGHWIETEHSWDAAEIADIQSLTVMFEDLMSDLEPVLTAICSHLGVPFEAGMLNYHETSTYHPPDPSIAQKWRRSMSPHEVTLVEGRLGDLLRRRGYEAFGRTKQPGWLERFFLSQDNRLRRWRFNIRRYGARLFFSHHLARGLGLRKLAAHFAREQEAIRLRNLQ